MIKKNINYICEEDDNEYDMNLNTLDQYPENIALIKMLQSK